MVNSDKGQIRQTRRGGTYYGENGALMRGLLHVHNSSLQKMCVDAVWTSAQGAGVEKGIRNFRKGFSTEYRHRPMPGSGGDRTADWQRGASATG
jgi:hypothetical protein